MNQYPLQNLDDDKFENLVVLICQKILGISTIAFAKGKDGGRDARFEGKANNYPSNNNPWNGKIIIQAKHTTKLNASCSDSEFKSIVKKEIPKIRNLVNKKEVDYYLVFTNRKLTGNMDSELRQKIKDECTIDCNIIGNETIQTYLSQYPDIVKAAKLNALLLPLTFDENDIKEVILAISESLKLGSKNKEVDFTAVEISEKNRLNKMGEEYFDNSIKPNFSEFNSIKNFISDPINSEINEIYMDAASDLKAKIECSREQYGNFEDIIEQIYDNITGSDPSAFRAKKRLVRLVLHYMYCTCDIGRKEK